MFEIEGEYVRTRGKSHKFPDIVAETLDFDEVIVVRLAGEQLKRNNRNVYGLDMNCNVIWQIPDRIHMSEHSPYVGLYRSGSFVEAFNWDGTSLKLDPRLGQVFSEGYVTMSSTSRRPRPVKSYM